MIDNNSYNLKSGMRNFLSPDEEKRWLWLVKNEKNYNWKDTDVIYNINSLGYRSKEFKHKEACNLYLGCSHTLGEGLPLENTFAYLINQHLDDYALYNAGVRGASPEDCFRRLQTFLHCNIKRVFFYVPHRARRSFFLNNQWQTLSMKKDWKFFSKCKPLFSSLYSVEYEQLMFDMAIRATKMLCVENNIPIYMLTHRDLRCTRDARDWSHWGIESHRNLANKFIDMIE